MRVVVSASLVLTIVACSRDTSSPPPEDVGCVASGAVVVPSVATLHSGDTVRVTASLRPCPGFPAFVEFRWRSSDTLIATVDPIAGLVRARRAGTATIIASAVLDPNVQGAMALAVVP